MIQTWAELMQMLEVTSNAESQATALLMCGLGELFPDDCRSTVGSSVVIVFGFSRSLWHFSSMGHRRGSRQVQIYRVWHTLKGTVCWYNVYIFLYSLMFCNAQLAGLPIGEKMSGGSDSDKLRHSLSLVKI